MPFTFQKLLDKTNEFDVSDITFTIKDNDVGLETIVKEFENFLLACGYPFKSLEIIYNELIDETNN